VKGVNLSVNTYGTTVNTLIDQFSKLPGIGKKSAERIAYYFLRCSADDAFAVADAIRQVKLKIRACPNCFNLTEDKLCSICADSRRDPRLICVVEQPRDLMALEAAGAFQGMYHVLQGRIAPLEGIGPDQLTIDQLVARVKRDNVRELIMATNPTLEGDGTSLYISNVLEGTGVKITRLARGIASGSVLEFANKEMLADAMRGRQSF